MRLPSDIQDEVLDSAWDTTARKKGKRPGGRDDSGSDAEQENRSRRRRRYESLPNRPTAQALTMTRKKIMTAKEGGM